jgi:hypothetical protein
LIILDRLEAAEIHRYSQLFHLNPNLEIAPGEVGIRTLNPGGGPIVQIIPLMTEDLEVRFENGTLRPRQGWVCTGPSRVIPNTVVEYRRSGTTVEFGTLLVPHPPDRRDTARVSIEGTPFESNARLQVVLGNQCDEILISPVGEMRLVTRSQGRHDG